MNDVIASYRRISVRGTKETDLDVVIPMERDPENSVFIGQWSRQQHVNAITSNEVAHWIIQTNSDGRIIGYIILSGLGNPDCNLDFTRIVIHEKGKGYGREAVQLIKREAFERFNAHRLYLDVMKNNHRARNLYLSEGFVEEGILRECMRVGDEFVSLVIMSMLSDEYDKLSCAPASSKVP